MRVLKFTIEPGDVVHIMVSKDARVVHVAEQRQTITFWMEVPDGEPATSGRTHYNSALEEISVYPSRRFVIFATGEKFLKDYYQYRGTALCAGGELVWHLYEVTTL